MASTGAEVREGLLDAEARAEMERTWRPRPGLYGWLASTDHKSVAKRYVATAFLFFILGGLEALLMRVQLARPENGLLDPDQYAQLFSMHGTTMMFLFGVPIQLAAAIYLVPLMVGTRNISFPRLNAFGYWTYLVGGLLLYSGFALNTGPDAGWFNYVPLAGPEYSPGKRIDVWAQTVTFTEIAALVAAVELIVTILKQRAPGMSLNRVPLYVWSILVTSFVVLFAMPSVALASLMLAFDRLVGTHYFNPAEGGDALLWQHLFWFFGHPEVYIMFLPATGFVSEIIPVFARRRIFGHTALVLALVATGFLSFGLWVHHMFTTGLPQLGQSFFTAASVMIAIPNGVQVFCWIATLWAGRPRFDTPLLFVLGFLVLFVMGGITGVMVASVPFDQQAHDTHFVVAHLHYVQIGAFVFPLFAAIYFWFPKVTGRMLSETLGKWNFWLFFAGVNLTFFPLHFLGLMGMTRRVYTYLPETGWGPLNLLATVGAFTIAASVAVFLANVYRSLRSGRAAGDDPWGAHTLEWGTSSPPPSYNFLHVPVVQGLYALWERTPDRPVVTGMQTRRREVLLTTVLDATPDARYEHPGPGLAPLYTALGLGVTFIGAIFTPWAFVAGPVLMFGALLHWFATEEEKEGPPTHAEEPA
ncbi:MAG TPA: cytochrome c oxidase subunit I [Longimicrobiaceae bacterium]|nr:cytochrome c oxidase subunit I [Longimicrobiaceae bacterium]